MSRIESDLPLPWDLLVPLPGFAWLRTAIMREAQASLVDILLHHTMSCKSGDPSGLDLMWGTPGAFRTEVRLQSSYDLLDFETVVYSGLADFERGPTEAALCILSYLLAHRPCGVHLEPSMLRDIHSVRESALILHWQARKVFPKGDVRMRGWETMPACKPRRLVQHRRGVGTQVVTIAQMQELHGLLAALPAGMVCDPALHFPQRWPHFMTSMTLDELQSLLLDFSDQVEVIEHKAFPSKWCWRPIRQPRVLPGPGGGASTGTQFAEAHAESTTEDTIPGPARH